ncbi:MAG: hypothetical protein IPN80_13670 [Flavobacterium sp.]|nr:hypothetical protein [Flavobacterium sp.]
MKKMYFSSLFVFISLLSFGQIVNIPDANFKAKLLAASPTNSIAASAATTAVAIDTNADGEIQVSEASLITYLDVNSANIASLEGIAAFTNLTSLRCSTNNLVSLDVTAQTNLLYLYCNNNTLLSLTGLSPLLNWLDCSFNQLTSLSTFSQVNLGGLQCNNNLLQELILPNSSTNPYTDASYNQLTTIDLSSIANLQQLILSHNNLTAIDFNHPSGIVNNSDISYLDLSYNPLVSLNINSFRSPNAQAPGDTLNLSNTLLTEITLPLAKFRFYFVGNNPNLVFLSVKNQANLINYSQCGDCGFYCGTNPLLSTICIADSSNSYLQSYFGNDTTINFTTYCSFTPSGVYNTISGNIKFDLDADGCNDADALAPNIPIKIVRAAQDLGRAFTNETGNYTTYSNSTSQTTLTPQFSNSYFTVTPASYTSSFTGFGNTETANFCIAANGVHNDLEAGIIAITPARPGFDATYRVVYKNKGTTTQSGTVTFYFNDFYCDFMNASSVPNSIQPDLLTWTFTNLAPLETREITIVLNVNSPIETPAVNAGDLLYFNSQVSPSTTDETYMDNSAKLTQIVLGSFDPNDKQVSALGFYFEYADLEDLYYTIRFQNLGTFAAENVVVSDVLSTNLDANKLQMVSASHPYVSRYNAATRKLEFIFEGINLPAAIDNEPASHGYVSFKIKPILTISPGQIIENNADIYFDFNAPITTNTASTIIETLLKTDDFSNSEFTLHPNPAKIR